MAVNGPALVAQVAVYIGILIVFLLPIILGFTVIRADANRLGEQGWV